MAIVYSVVLCSTAERNTMSLRANLATCKKNMLDITLHANIRDTDHLANPSTMAGVFLKQKYMTLKSKKYHQLSLFLTGK